MDIIGSFFSGEVGLIDGWLCVTWLLVGNNELQLHNIPQLAYRRVNKWSDPSKSPLEHESTHTTF